jgi:hypothetical protein
MTAAAGDGKTCAFKHSPFLISGSVALARPAAPRKTRSRQRHAERSRVGAIVPTRAFSHEGHSARLANCSLYKSRADHSVRCVESVHGGAGTVLRPRVWLRLGNRALGEELLVHSDVD